MKDLIIFLDNNGKSSIYTGGDINGLYFCLEMIGSPNTLTTSGHHSHHFVPSSSTNIDTSTLQPVISDLHVRNNLICECSGKIVHKADAWIIRGPNFLPPILRINVNQFNTLHGDEKNEPTIEWNIQPIEYHFKSRTYPPKISPVVSDIMGRLNHQDIYNGNVENHSSEFPF